MERRYTIIESVGSHVERVRSYEDLEKHHPTWKEDHARRHYATIDGEREEFAISPSGERLVSKDFVLKVDGRTNVAVPSPVAGYVRRSDRMDRWGTVEIYDGTGPDARLVARIRHMQPIYVSDGDRVELGQSLGAQGRKAPGKVGVHTHMDIAESHLGDFKRYIHGLDSGAITPTTNGNRIRDPVAKVVRPAEHDALSLGVSGPEVRHLQQSLQRLGFTGRDGRPLRSDGDFGPNTESAVRAFQRDHGLHVDGVVGKDTIRVLALARANPFADNTHPQHVLYAQALGGVHAEEDRRRVPHGRHSEHLAGALTMAAANAGLARIDRVELNTTGTLARAVQVHPLRDEPSLNRTSVSVDTHAALATPPQHGTGLTGQPRQAAPMQPDLQPAPPRIARISP